MNSEPMSIIQPTTNGVSREVEVFRIAQTIVERIHATSDILCANNGEVDESLNEAVLDCIYDVLLPVWPPSSL